MARTALVPVTAVDEGAVFALTAANVDGHSIPGGGGTLLVVNNAAGAPITVTIETAATEDGLAVADQAVTVAAGTQKVIGRFRSTTYDRPVGGTDAGLVWVNFSAVTSVTVGAIAV